MEPFVSGVLFMETFPTTQGDIQVLAGVSTEGNTLRLVELSITQAGLEPQRPGVTILRGIADQISGAALAQGFDRVEFEGVRETGSRIGRKAFAVGRGH